MQGMMERRLRKRKISESPASSHAESASRTRHLQSAPSPKPIKLKKKKVKSESSPKVLLSNVIETPKVAKKTPNFHSSPNDSFVSDLSDDSDSSTLKPHLNTSAINKGVLESSFNCDVKDDPKDLTDDRVFEEIADHASDMDSDESLNDFYKRKKKELTPPLQPPLKKRKIDQEFQSSVITPLRYRKCVVVMLNHPSSISLNDYVSIEVLSGCISIQGHMATPQSERVKILSSKEFGFTEVKTESFEQIWMTKEKFLNLSHRLHKIAGDPKEAMKIMNKVGANSVLFTVEPCVLPPKLQFLKLYIPEVFNFKLTDNFLTKFLQIDAKAKPYDTMYCLPNNKNTVQFSSDVEDLACDISSAVRSSKLNRKEGPRILVFGPKNSGKSSLLRFLINKILCMFPEAYYLDADPGQSEFTPPGVVSLTEVKKPLFGPAFSHQRKPVSMCFTGGVTADSPDMYHRCVSKLVNLYHQNHSSEPLFVNTMGWVKGIGLECLKSVLACVRPTILVEMITEDEDTMFDYRGHLPEGADTYQIISPHNAKEKTDKTPAHLARDLSILAYFGKCQLAVSTPKYLNSFKPFSVSWDKISMYIFGRKVPHHRIVESLNASVVALCNVDKSLHLLSKIKQYPDTLVDEPDNECIGFGIVRNLDESKRLLYVTTPLLLKELKNVNAILKGNIMLPDSLILKQPIVGEPLPFSDHRCPKGQVSEAPKGESESDSEHEAFIDSNTVSDGYRKSIKKKSAQKKRPKKKD